MNLADEIVQHLITARNACNEALELIVGPEPDPVPYVDRVDEMPVNLKPHHADFLRCFPGRDMWPLRSLDDIDGITVHHTLSHSPLAAANYCTQAKGYPTVQYHFWVSAGDGCPVYRLVDEAVQLWHDHTGTYQTTLSVGLAGRWDYYVPPGEQLTALVELVAWLMRTYRVPIEEVQGHCTRALPIITVCPGWYRADWHDAFFDLLEAEVG